MADIKIYEEKKAFVEQYVKPMILAMGIDAVDCVYEYGINEKGWAFETVKVFYGECRWSKHAIVNGDSFRAILYDMYAQHAIE